MTWCVKWVVLWSLWAARVVRQPTPPLLVSNGWLRRSVAYTGTHAQYLGIPYATVVQRFQAPGPEPKWQGTFEAIEEYVRCRQPARLNSTFTSGQEDCLILNVYTPFNTPPGRPLPVMVFIHGGGFFQNSGSLMTYGPEYLTSKGVILVTINYRLNIQGFLCLGIKEAPGNAGMKDQVAALKWVQRNIRAFGGDPDNVTIFGESAGAASVSFHILSPMSKGLFHKAITQSGSSLSAWAFQYNPVYLASLLAKAMNYDTMDAKELYEYFMTKTDTDLVVTRVPRQEGNTVISEILYAPCAEQKIDGVEPFLAELPHDMLSKGTYNKIPIMIGSNSQEGLLFVGMENEYFINQLVLEKAFPKDLTFPSNETRKLVKDKLKEVYFGEDEILTEVKAKLSKLYGEQYFNYPVTEETELLIKTSGQPIYPFIFSYDGVRNILKALLSKDLKKVYGATHAEDIFYLFSPSFLPLISTETEMINKMTTLWTNFAKFGDPTPRETELLPVKWSAASSQDQRAFVIDKEFTTIPLWHSDSLRFWKDVYSKYRRKL